MPLITPDERLRRPVDSKVRRFMADEQLWPADAGVLLAVSGGPDSTTLLLVLSRLARRVGAKLVVAYFDHALRGEAGSAAEREAVERLTAMLDLPLVTGTGDVQSEAKRRKTSIEAAARRLRYEFLRRAATEAGCGTVATGHTLDDQAETVLLHVLRGAGLRGLAGMAARSAWPFAGVKDLTLVRPLLILHREETLAYCAAAGIQPVHDESNDSRAYQRNRVRHDLMPALRRFNPRVEEALVRLADAAREGKPDDALPIAVDDGEVVLDRARLEAAGAASRHAIFASAFGALGGNRDGINAKHYRALDRLVAAGRTGDRLDLPSSVVVELRRDAMALRIGVSAVEALPDCAVALPVPGEVRFGPLTLAANNSPLSGAIASAMVDLESVGEGLFVRRRRTGDRTQPAGMNGTKKLQDLFVDAHLPRHERDSIPIFENERGIAWVGSMCVADWARPRDARPTVTLSYRKT